MSWQGWGTGLAIFPPRQICSVALEADVIIEFDVVTEQWMDKLEINGICKLAIVSRFCRKPKKKKKAVSCLYKSAGWLEDIKGNVLFW